MQTAKADDNEARRKAAEAAAADAEKELFDLQQLKKSQVSALEREVARLGETVHRQTEEISRTRSEMDARVRQVRQAFTEAGASTKRRLQQIEFQLKASTNSGVRYQRKNRELKERLRAFGDTSADLDESETEGGHELEMSEFRTTGNFYGTTQADIYAPSF